MPDVTAPGPGAPGPGTPGPGTPDFGAEATRRRLTQRQAGTVAKLTSAAMEEVRATGYAGLTVRNVAARARVGTATAYMYFSSKEHLVAEVYWRTLRALPPVPAASPDDDRPAAERVAAVIREIVMVAAAEPDLAAAATVSLLGSSPDVHDLRLRVGLTIRERLVAALGDGYDPAVLTALEYASSGAMLQAGMGFTSYEEAADRLADTTRLVLRD